MHKFMALFYDLKEDEILQTKFTCKEDQAAFLNRFKEYGYKNKSSMLREALNLLKKKKESQELCESAELYAEVYNEDSELKKLTASAMQGWPE
jgi:glycogen debranching enzyme